MKRQIILSIVLIVALIGCKEDPQAGKVIGTVRDEVSREPLEEATIQVEGKTTTYSTDSDGKYTIPDLAPGAYTLTASRQGYFSSSEALTLSAGQNIQKNFLLSIALPAASPKEVYLNYNKNSETVTLSNQSSVSMAFTTETSQTWLSITPASGTIHAGGSLTVTITANYADLPIDLYEETVSVTVKDEVLNIPVDVNLEDAVDITWKNWYLSVPIDNGEGKATSIYYQDIINDNLTEAEREYFYYDEAASGYTLYTKFTGFTTSGTYPLNGAAYCRTELREFWQGNQTTEDNWYMNTGETHLMESTLRVDYCEGNGRTFIAQIHGKESTDPTVTNGPATVKVLWENGYIEVEYYVKPPNPAGEWTSTYNAKSARIKVDNEKFTIKLRVLNGVLSYALICEAKGINNDFIDLFDYATNGYHYDNYFKTGNYFQWKSDYDESSQVTIFKIVTHHE